MWWGEGVGETRALAHSCARNVLPPQINKHTHTRTPRQQGEAPGEHVLIVCNAIGGPVDSKSVVELQQPPKHLAIGAGAVVEAGDVATIPGRLATGSIETRRQVDDDIWDTWPVLALLVGLYCADIAIRRLSGLS